MWILSTKLFGFFLPCWKAWFVDSTRWKVNFYRDDRRTQARHLVRIPLPLCVCSRGWSLRCTQLPHIYRHTGPWWPRFHWCRRKPEETKQLSNIWLKIPLQSRFKDPDVFYDVESFFNSYQAFLSCFSFAHFFLLSVRRWGLGFSSSLDWCKGTCPISGGTCERIWCRYEMDDLMLLIHWYRHVSVFLKSKQVWWSNLKSV